MYMKCYLLVPFRITDLYVYGFRARQLALYHQLFQMSLGGQVLFLKIRKVGEDTKLHALLKDC